MITQQRTDFARRAWQTCGGALPEIRKWQSEVGRLEVLIALDNFWSCMYKEYEGVFARMLMPIVVQTLQFLEQGMREARVHMRQAHEKAEIGRYRWRKQSILAEA